MTPAQRGGKNALRRGRFVTVHQLRDDLEAVLRQAWNILLDGIDGQRERIIEIVIVKAGDMDIALQQVMLAHIAQHPFQQPAGGGKQRFRRAAQARAEGGGPPIPAAWGVVAGDESLRAGGDTGARQPLPKARQAIFGR